MTFDHHIWATHALRLRVVLLHPHQSFYQHDTPMALTHEPGSDTMKNIVGKDLWEAYYFIR